MTANTRNPHRPEGPAAKAGPPGAGAERNQSVPNLRSEWRWLSSGFLLTLSSGFGQTYFIAIFAGQLKAELDMSDGVFGGLFTAGTLTSAALLIWAGKLADRFSIRWTGAAVLGGLAAAALGMASVNSLWMLGLVLFGLRFFGQGMLTHVAMTAMGRWFNRNRGRAVSIAALGLPTGEALLPLAAVALTGLIGWRMTWVAGACALLLLSAPALVLLLKRERKPAHARLAGQTGEGIAPRREWTRTQVLASPLFYALVPGVLATPFVITGIFFNQVPIVELKGWELAWFAANFPVMAACNVTSALISGWLADKFGARRLLPVLLTLLGCTTLVLTLAEGTYLVPAFMALAGVSLGAMATIHGAMWAELYGTAHLGAIRGLSTAIMVFASAMSPGLIGVLLDTGVALEQQLMAMAVGSFAVAVFTAALMPWLDRLADG